MTPLKVLFDATDRELPIACDRNHLDRDRPLADLRKPSVLQFSLSQGPASFLTSCRPVNQFISADCCRC
jgi:hypothetical protein